MLSSSAPPNFAALDPTVIDRFLSYSHRRRYPARTDIFRPGDAATTLYYVVSGSVSIIAEEKNDQELILSYVNAGGLIGEMGLFEPADIRQLILRTRTTCELAEISYERLFQLIQGPLSADAATFLYMVGAQLSKRLLSTTRKASRLAFLDVASRIHRTLFDLSKEPEAMSHPDGTQLRVSRQELARLVGCSREMAGRVLKKLEEDGLLHAHGKTIVLFGTR